MHGGQPDPRGQQAVDHPLPHPGGDRGGERTAQRLHRHVMGAFGHPGDGDVGEHPAQQPQRADIAGPGAVERCDLPHQLQVPPQHHREIQQRRRAQRGGDGGVARGEQHPLIGGAVERGQNLAVQQPHHLMLVMGVGDMVAHAGQRRSQFPPVGIERHQRPGEAVGPLARRLHLQPAHFEMGGFGPQLLDPAQAAQGQQFVHQHRHGGDARRRGQQRHQQTQHQAGGEGAVQQVGGVEPQRHHHQRRQRPDQPAPEPARRPHRGRRGRQQLRRVARSGQQSRLLRLRDRSGAVDLQLHRWNPALPGLAGVGVALRHSR